MRSHHNGDQMAPPSRSAGTRSGGGGCVGEGKSRVAVTPLIVNTLEPVAAASWAGVMELIRAMSELYAAALYTRTVARTTRLPAVTESLRLTSALLPVAAQPGTYVLAP